MNTEYQSSNETLWSCSLRCQTICLTYQGSSASGQFVVTAFICGISCRILFDTGASVCFVEADHNIIDESSKCSDRNSHYTSGGLQICLGDNSKIAAQGCVQLPLSISGKQYAWDFHVINRRNHCWPNKRNRNETWGEPSELSGVRQAAWCLYGAGEPSWA